MANTLITACRFLLVLMVIAFCSLFLNYIVKSNSDSLFAIRVNPDTSRYGKNLNPLIFTIVNHGYIEFAKNWILHLQILVIDNWQIICTDIQSYNELKHWIIDQDSYKIILNNNNSTILSSKYLAYKMIEFTKYTKQRPVILYNLYNKYSNDYFNNISLNYRSYDSLLYVDADTVFIKDYQSSLKTLKLKNYDIILQLDAAEQNTDCVQYPEKNSLYRTCSCIIFIPFNIFHHNRIINFLYKWQQISEDTSIKNDQFALNVFLRKNRNNNSTKTKINIGYLNCSEYPSGYLMKDDKWRKHYEDHIVMVHANYLYGYKRKKKFLIKHNHWYLDKQQL